MTSELVAGPADMWIHDVEDDLSREIERRATANRRALSEEASDLLENGLEIMEREADLKDPAKAATLS